MYNFQNKKIYIHIGYPKTGTTSIQANIFAQLNQIDYIGQPYNSAYDKSQVIVHTLTDCEEMEYNAHRLCQLIDDYCSDYNKLLISEETFSTGSNLSGRVDRFTIANRLKKIAPDATILISLREQSSIIKSFYLQLLSQ